jgi:hypothetical protein
MNYIPEHNPDYVNNLIQNYIDTVMLPGCKQHWRKKDQWTVAQMVSWERFGMTICNNCYDNRERLHMIVHDFKEEYDKQCQIIINRETTAYRDLPYKIKGSLEGIGMEIFPKGYKIINDRIIPNSDGTQIWDPENIRKVGELVYTKLSTEQFANLQWETANLKVEQIISNWNISVLTKQVANLVQQVQELEDKTDIPLNLEN